MEWIKRYKGFFFLAMIVILFVGYLILDNGIEKRKMAQKYEKEIVQLKDMVQISNIGKVPEQEYDIYETAEQFMTLYYGVSEEVTETYRDEQLKRCMTETAYNSYEKAYEQSLGYTSDISNIEIYVDYRNSTEQGVYACIFFDQNINWPNVDTIVLHKYWKGVFVSDNGTWKMSEITDCQELLTREEFNVLNTDTNGNVLEDIPGGDNNDKKEEKESNH